MQGKPLAAAFRLESLNPRSRNKQSRIAACSLAALRSMQWEIRLDMARSIGEPGREATPDDQSEIAARGSDPGVLIMAALVDAAAAAHPETNMDLAKSLDAKGDMNAAVAAYGEIINAG